MSTILSADEITLCGRQLPRFAGGGMATQNSSVRPERCGFEQYTWAALAGQLRLFNFRCHCHCRNHDRISFRNELAAEGLSHITMTRLAQRLKARAASCLRLIQ